jgi:proteasome accessory factor B
MFRTSSGTFWLFLTTKRQKGGHLERCPPRWRTDEFRISTPDYALGVPPLGGRGLPLGDEIRTFAITRMSKAKRTTRKYQKLEDFDPDEYLAHSIGIHAGGTTEKIAALHGRGRAPHFGAGVPREPEVETAAGWRGGDEHEGGDPELERLILGFGAEAEVLEPASLRQKIRTHAGKMLAMYR